jgi:hypothetical protein
MMLQRLQDDPRPFHVKVGPTIHCGDRVTTLFISVCPPAHDSDLDDDVVWKEHRPSLHHHESDGTGPTGILDYIISRADNEDAPCQ